MNAKRKFTHRGFFKMILIITAAIAILIYFDIDVQSFVHDIAAKISAMLNK